MNIKFFRIFFLILLCSFTFSACSDNQKVNINLRDSKKARMKEMNTIVSRPG